MAEFSESAALTSPEGEVPERVVAGLHARLGSRLVSVVLFGSRARGDDRPDSDWDLLVIAEGLPPHPLDRRSLLIGGLPVDLRSSIVMLSKTPQEIEAALPSIYLDIALDGRILYDPRSYARDRLEKLNQIIARVGLYRERTPSGHAWNWRKPPAGRWSVQWNS